jgi:hypothetical protein
MKAKILAWHEADMDKFLLFAFRQTIRSTRELVQINAEKGRVILEG